MYDIIWKSSYVLWLVFWLADYVYFTPKRYRRYKEEMVKGIIADLKKNDQTLVIKETEGYRIVTSSGRPSDAGVLDN